MRAMLQLLLDQINSFEFEEAGGVALLESAQAEEFDGLHLRLRVEVDGVRTPWQVRCQSVREHRLQFGVLCDPFDLREDHTLLSNIAEDHVSLFVARPAKDPAATMLALFNTHSPLFNRWCSPLRYFNSGVSPCEILSSFGMLACGPKSVIKEYAAVLTAHSVRWSVARAIDSSYYRNHDEVWTNGHHELRILTLGDSYVIATGFEAEETFV